MKKILRFVKPHIFFTIMAPLFMVVEVVMDLIQPQLMSDIVDLGIAQGDQRFVVITCVKMVLCALAGLIGGFGCTYFSTKASFGFAKDIRKALYEKIQHFSFANIDKFKTGSLVTRVTNDVSQIQNAFQSCLRALIRSPLLFIGGVIQVAFISLKLSTVLAVSIPVLAVLIVFLMKKSFPLFRIVQDKLDRVNTVMQENLAGVRVIKAFGRSDHEKKRFKTANEDLMAVNMTAQKVMAVAFPLLTLIMNFTLLAVYWFGGGMVLEGSLSTGDIMAFASYITQILSSLTMSSFMLIFISRAKVSVDRVNEVLDTKIDIMSGGDADAQVTSGRVEFKDVTFSYPGQSGAPVLQDINFTIEPGTTVAILGSTGSGKTSLVSLIPRLYDASKGSVLIDGVDVRDYKVENLRKGIGVALQESVLFTGTIAENLRWGNEEASDEELTQMADIAQASAFIARQPGGMDNELSQRGVNLSGGQKQRLSIARALVKRPKVLILDDSTSAVDLTTEAQIQKGLREVMGHCTVFIIAQRISSVMDADKILVMENGRVIDSGTHAELTKRCDVYKEIVESQMGKEAV